MRRRTTGAVGASLSVALMAAGLAVSGHASAGTADTVSIADKRGDSVSEASDIVRMETSVSPRVVQVRVLTAAHSPIASRDGSLTIELDTDSDPQADWRVSTAAPWKIAEITQQGQSAPTRCKGQASYRPVRSGAQFLVSLPAACLGYPVSVAAAATLILPLDYEEAFDEAGSLAREARRSTVPSALAVLTKSKKKPQASVQADLSMAGERAVVKVRAGKSWKPVVSGRLVARNGKAFASMPLPRLRAGSSLGLFLRGKLADTARVR